MRQHYIWFDRHYHTDSSYQLFRIMRKRIIRYSIVAVLCLAVFFVNNLWFKKLDISYDYPFIRNHLNDTMATIFLLSCLSLMRLLQKRNSSVHFAEMLAICTAASIMWEYVAEFVKPDSTFDYIDILCYFLGGLLYYFANKI